MSKTVIRHITMFFVVMIFSLLTIACFEEKAPEEHPEASREDSLPTDIVKRTPETDLHPPILHSNQFEEPIPLPGFVNTSGLEDSPYISEDGSTLYFFFTPDARIAHNEQLLDEVTGIWVSQKMDGLWQEPERVWLQEPGKLALDGCPTIFEDTLWFCSAREGYTGVQLFISTFENQMWNSIIYANELFPEDFDMGEMHRHENTIYFHSMRSGGKGGFDIWITTLVDETWTAPINLETINSEGHDSLPFVSYDGKELWFTRTYLGTPALFRSLLIDGVWQEPELIVSMFAGEPTLDEAGNLYFVHHYFENDVMIEADIYVAYKIKN